MILGTVPAAAYEKLMDMIEKLELNAVADARKDGPFREIGIDDL